MAVYEYPPGRRTWNADLDPNGVSDVDYIRAAIEAVDRKVAVDRKRNFATGMSGGGRMSSRIGCELAGQIAARNFARLGKTNLDIDASQLMWEFFAVHPLP